MTPLLVSSSLRVYTEVPPSDDPGDVHPPTFARYRRSDPAPVEHVIVVDFETTTDLAQRLTFGSARQYELIRHDSTVTARERREWVIYADDLPERDPDGHALLVDYARRHRLRLRSLDEWLRWVVRRAIRSGVYIAGYNLPFDLARMARQWGAARRGIRGFTLNLWTYQDSKTGRPRQSLYRSRARVRQLGPHSRSMEWSIPPRGDVPIGGLLDVSQLVFALTDRRYGLAKACDAFGCTIGKGDPGAHGVITEGYIDYARRDVAATGELLAAALTELETRWPGLHPTRAYTPASLGRSALGAFGLPPTRERWPDWPVDLNGEAMAGYFGGRTECRVRKTPVPCVVCDFLSQYPTVCALLGVWRLLTSKRIRAVDCADDLRELLDRVARDGPRVVLDPDVWPAMAGFARVVCDGDVAVPVRAAYAPRCDGPVDHRTAVSVLTADKPCVYSIPDLVASVLLTGRVPEIVTAWRLEGEGRVDGLVPLDVEGVGAIDPYRDDPYVRWIELRKRIAADPTVLDHERDRLVRALKIVANATAYGLLVQCTKKDGESGDLVVATDQSVTHRHVPEVETFGDYAFPPLGALITAGGRLLLAITERLVSDLGGTLAFCDTDSAAIVATPDGGPVPCPGGSARMPDGEDAVMALSHDQVVDVVRAFDRLNPYDRDLVTGSVLEVESYCREDPKRPVGGDNPPRSVTYYGISSKRYVLFHGDESGGRQLVKPSEHGLGRWLIPEIGGGRPVDRDAWYRSVWQWALARDLDGVETPPDWAHRMAVAKLPLQTPHSLRLLDGYNSRVGPDEQIRPYGFAMVATANVARSGETMYVAPFADDPGQWERLDWYTRRDAARVRLVRYTEPFEDVENWLEVPNPEHLPLRKAKTYWQVLQEWADNPESKLAGSDGEPCEGKTVGLLRRRQVRTSAVTTWYRGRGDLTDDDTYDAAEGAQATVYRDPTLPLLRQAVEVYGVETFAGLAGINPRTVRRFVGGETSRSDVIRRFEKKMRIEANRETGMRRGDLIRAVSAFMETRREGLPGSSRACQGCDKTFMPNDPRQRYHSDDCRNAAKQRAYRARNKDPRP